jgi:sucrose phosphorylase
MANQKAQERILKHLTSLYGKDRAPDIFDKLTDRLKQYKIEIFYPQSTPLDTLEDLDAVLFTYGDQFQSPGKAHMNSLAEFIKDHLDGLISGVHILPFFPYSSDDGFSVINYKEVDPHLGTWQDLDPLRDCCNLMFDAVINHISRESDWFQYFLQGISPYDDYFHVIDPSEDLSLVTRPRAKPLLTKVNTNTGPKHVWTTFSPDQIDLNYENPDLLIDILDVMLFYVQQGARMIRLDAIAYLWKEIGTTCIHLPQTHQIIKLLRAVLDQVAPGVILITETNVPHEENISYFGKPLPDPSRGLPVGDEAQMVYQFPLAPLVLHTFQTEDSRILTQWAGNLEIPYSTATFLNFIASHDGIGIRPAEGILTDIQIQELVDQTIDHGGQISYKTNQDGSKSVYELNITLFDALNKPGSKDIDTKVNRFLASQAIMLSLAGVPGIYIHSLFGSPNFHDGVSETGRYRTINRQKFQYLELVGKLNDPASRTAQVFNRYSHYLKTRQGSKAFKPLAGQQVFNLDKRVFSILRTSQDRSESILCIINISNVDVKLQVDRKIISPAKRVDILTGEEYSLESLVLEPYQVLWLK